MQSLSGAGDVRAGELENNAAAKPTRGACHVKCHWAMPASNPPLNKHKLIIKVWLVAQIVDDMSQSELYILEFGSFE